MPKRFLVHCQKVKQQLEQYKISPEDWVDAQFFFFLKMIKKIPGFYQLGTEKAYDRYVFYLENDGKNIDNFDFSKDITFSLQKKIQAGRELLDSIKKNYPELDEKFILRMFVDIFPHAFIKKYISDNEVNTLPNQIMSCLGKMKKRINNGMLR